MQSFCRLSRRWHQQFCHSVTFSAHQQCFRQVQPIRHYRTGVKSRNLRKAIPREPVVVREYEQFEDDPSTRLEIDPKEDIEDEAERVKAKLDALQEEIEILKEGPFGPRSEFMQALPEGQRGRLLKALEDEGVTGDYDYDDLFGDETMEEMSKYMDPGQEDRGVSSLSVTLSVPSKHRAYVRHFNDFLQRAIEDEDDPRAVLAVWRWYLRCQQYVPGFVDVVSEDVWRFLWKSQTTTIYRPKHVILLAKDMLRAETQLDGYQWIGYLKALRDDKQLAEALEVWKERQDDLAQQSTIAAEYWELGVQIYVGLGRPQKAQDLALYCLEKRDVVDQKILVHLVSAWAQSQHPLAPQKIWTCYLMIKTRLQNQISHETYDEIGSALLRNGRVELALAVFKDLYLSVKGSSMDSLSVYATSVARLPMDGEKVSEEDITRVSLTALTLFPKQLNNKFFFGSWIKRLIGAQDLDGALSVLDLMYERGVVPYAIHVNGIIGALFRDDSPDLVKRGRDLAWNMISARIKMVKDRDHREGIPLALFRKVLETEAGGASEKRIETFVKRPMPAATLETCTIMLQQYLKKADFSQATQFTEMMIQEADIKPDTYFLNQLLAAQMKTGSVGGVWSIFTTMFDTVRPDMETFAVVWDAAQKQYDPARASFHKEFPTARKLFGLMIQHFEFWSPAELERAKGEFSVDMYDQIIRCFCLSWDLPGTFCALQELYRLFDHLPSEIVSNMICLQVAHRVPLEPDERPRRHQRKRRNYDEALARAMMVVEKLREEKAFELVESGVDTSELEDSNSPASGKLRLDALSTFICMIMERVGRETFDGITNQIVTVAKVMGVPKGHLNLPERSDSSGAQPGADDSGAA